MVARRHLIIMFMALLMPLVLIACGGNNDEPPSPTATPVVDMDVESIVPEAERGTNYYEVIGESYTYTDIQADTNVLTEGQYITITLGNLTENPLGIGPLPRDVEPGTYDIQPFALTPGERTLSAQFNEIQAEMVFVALGGTLIIESRNGTISGSFEFGAIQRPRDESEPQTAVIRGTFADVELPPRTPGLETLDD